VVAANGELRGKKIPCGASAGEFPLPVPALETHLPPAAENPRKCSTLQVY
jgi:hypothetical protein